MKIMLISGHGAGDPGAMAKIRGVEYREAELTGELVSKILAALDRYNVTALAYDFNRDAYQDYKNGLLSFDRDINYILEIHFNACVQDYAGDGKTTGVEIYWPSRGKPSGAESALLKRVSDIGLRNRGSYSKGLAVINTAAGTGIPANLLEVCFIDDADDMKIYTANKDVFAREIAAGIADAFGLAIKQEVKPAAPSVPWWEKSGEWADAKRLGITDGTRPEDRATRAEVAAMVLRAIDYIINHIKEG